MVYSSRLSSEAYRSLSAKRTEVCGYGAVSFDTTLRVTQSTGGKSRLSSMLRHTYRSLSAKRIEACGYGAVSFDAPLRGTQSTGNSSRLSSEAYRSLSSMLRHTYRSLSAQRIEVCVYLFTFVNHLVKP